MKMSLLVSGLLSLIVSACKDRQIYCVGIGNNLKEWTVYNPNDSINMHDQLGNHVTYVLSNYDDKPSYYATEYGGLMKKQVTCVGMQHISDNSHFFSNVIESTSSEYGDVRNPDSFNFQLTIGDLFAGFVVNKNSGVLSLYSNDPQGSIMNNVESGGTVYPEAFVFEGDTTLSSFNVYRFIYAKDKGLVEFSTKDPQRTWLLD